MSASWRESADDDAFRVHFTGVDVAREQRAELEGCLPVARVESYVARLVVEVGPQGSNVTGALPAASRLSLDAVEHVHGDATAIVVVARDGVHHPSPCALVDSMQHTPITRRTEAAVLDQRYALRIAAADRVGYRGEEVYDSSPEEARRAR